MSKKTMLILAVVFIYLWQAGYIGSSTEPTQSGSISPMVLMLIMVVMMTSQEKTSNLNYQ